MPTLLKLEASSYQANLEAYFLLLIFEYLVSVTSKDSKFFDIKSINLGNKGQLQGVMGWIFPKSLPGSDEHSIFDKRVLHYSSCQEMEALQSWVSIGFQLKVQAPLSTD